jgi:subtilisin
MAWARQNGMNVVSMSLGASSCPSVAYTNAIAQLNASGVTVVCAAGNGFQSPFPCVGSPANSRGAIAVAAVDANKAIAPFSSRGTQCCPPGANPVSISAPGVSINSTVLANGYGIKSGTSMACPHVAGGAALVKQRFPFFTPAQIRAKLLGTAADLGVPGNDPVFGSGLLNCNAATL